MCMQAGIFGVLYTLAKEKYDKSRKWAVARVVLEFIQCLLLVVKPSAGWAIDKDVWIWQVVSSLYFRNPILSKVSVRSLALVRPSACMSYAFQMAVAFYIHINQKMVLRIICSFFWNADAGRPRCYLRKLGLHAAFMNPFVHLTCLNI